VYLLAYSPQQKREVQLEKYETGQGQYEYSFLHQTKK
jgi:hypothetical protein